MQNYQELKTIFARLSDLEHVQAIVNWDEAVNMPVGAGANRARAMASLRSLAHEMLTSSEVSDLLAKTQPQELTNPWDKANLHWMQRTHQHATCVPSALVAKLTQASLQCEQVWRELRPANDWQSFVPLLEKNFALVKEAAQYKSDALEMSPYDVLLDEYSPGVSQAMLEPIFAELKAFLPRFIQQVLKQQKQQRYPNLPKPFSPEKQRSLGLQLMQQIGFDFDHGRLDVSHHPFCGGVSDDVRITTRYNKDEFVSAIMGICHETGHALYEQGLPMAWYGQPVGQALGMAMHESQSLLMEMQACRSEGFMHYLTPLLKQTFPQLASLQVAELQALYLRVQPGLIRVDADEVTYPLHVILRYEIERDLFAGKLSIADLPQAWDEGMQSYLGLSTKDNYSDGVMQDVHWPAALFGYFPSYTLGALISAQLFQTATTQHSNIHEELMVGNFSTLVDWLREHVHSNGCLLSADQLLKQATGEVMSAKPFIQHIQQRYM